MSIFKQEGRIVPVYRKYRAVPYDVPQIGFENDTVNNLRLWDVEIPEEYELEYPTIGHVITRYYGYFVSR